MDVIKALRNTFLNGMHNKIQCKAITSIVATWYKSPAVIWSQNVYDTGMQDDWSAQFIMYPAKNL